MPLTYIFVAILLTTKKFSKCKVLQKKQLIKYPLESNIKRI